MISYLFEHRKVFIEKRILQFASIQFNLTFGKKIISVHNLLVCNIVVLRLNKMISNATFIFMLVCLSIACTAMASAMKCTCYCCVGVDCKVVAKPSFFVSSCDTKECPNKCTTTYPVDCDSPTSQMLAACMSAASSLTNRYVSLVFIGIMLSIYMRQSHSSC